MNEDNRSQEIPEQSQAPELDTTPPQPMPSMPSIPGETEQTVPVNVQQPAAVAPVVTTEPAVSNVAPPTVVGAAPKAPKKKWVIGTIIGVVLALLIGGSVAAYNLWYQNPDKVLSDAFVNMVQAKSVIYTGTIDLEPKGQTSSSLKSFKISIDGKNDTAVGELNVTFTANYNGKDIVMAASGIADKDGNLYIKLKDIRKTLESFSTTGTISLPPAYDSLITKMDNKWIKITKDDLGQYDENYKKQRDCVTDTIKRLGDDKEAVNELGDLYRSNKFIVVKENLGSKDGSLGYRIDGDEDKAKSFARGLNDTKAFKELQKCDSDFKVDENDLKSTSRATNDNGEMRFEVWIDRWSHRLTSIKITGDNQSAKGTVVINTEFDKQITVEAPTTDIVTYAELKKDVEAIYAGTYSQYSGIQQSAQSTSARVNASSVAVQVNLYRSNNRGQLPTFAQLKAQLNSTVAGKLISTLPSAANPTAVQYRTCGASRYEINYYDSSTARIVNVSGMSCAGSTSS